MKQINNFFSIYIIEGKDGDILIDTGFIFMKKKLFKILDNYNIKYIILTHAHIDHVWNTAYIKERYNAKVAIGKKDATNLDNSLLKCRATKWYYRPIAGIYNFGMKVLKQKKIIVDEYLEDNQIITKHGLTFKIIDLEGHTPGSIGIIDENKNLYCGDALLSRCGKIRLAWQNNNNKVALESVKKILKLDIKEIYFGHSKPRSKEELKRLENIISIRENKVKK